jgi:hypothetical protein
MFAAFGCLRLLAVCGPSAWVAGLPGMADGVSVGYVRWVGVWARAWEGRAGSEAEWRGSGMGGEGSGMGGSGILGLLGHADRRALIGLKSLYYWSCSGHAVAQLVWDWCLRREPAR